MKNKIIRSSLRTINREAALVKKGENFKQDKEADSGENLSGKKYSKLERIGMMLGLLFIAFMLGFVPMWLVKRTAAIERDTAVRELNVSRLQTQLGSSIVHARIGEYEPARIAASGFFTDLRTEIEREENAAFSSGQSAAFQPILAERDEVITLLARGDPASVERLTNLYLAYLKIASQVPPE
jgi:hypothetical protein